MALLCSLIQMAPRISFIITFSSPPGDRPPESPSGLTAADIASDYVVLRWDPTSGALYYVIKYGRLDKGETEALRDTAQSNEWTAVGLDPEAEYVFSVLAVNSHGSSYPSEQISVVTLGTSG